MILKLVDDYVIICLINIRKLLIKNVILLKGNSCVFDIVVLFKLLYYFYFDVDEKERFLYYVVFIILSVFG